MRLFYCGTGWVSERERRRSGAFPCFPGNNWGFKKFLLPPGTRLPERRKEGRERERKKEKKDLERQMGVASEKRWAVIFAAGSLFFVL